MQTQDNQAPKDDLSDGFDSDVSEDIAEDDLEDLLSEETDSSLACSDSTLQKMHQLLSIQDNLNSSFVGADWVSRARDRDVIDYQPPILDEAAELMRSLPQWKFWKTGQVADLTNARLEFIDILHFTLSEAMARVENRDTLARTMGFWYEGVFDGWGDSSLQRICAYSFHDTKVTLNRFLRSVFGFGYQEDSETGTMEDPDLDWEAFWDIAFNLGMSGEDVYLTYICKVGLNHFRIANGDKHNHYHRNWWEGQEDNFYLMRQTEAWKRDAVTVTLETVKEWLQSQYNEYLNTLRRADQADPV